MNAKERVRNDILVGMKLHLDACTMAILDAVIVKAVQNVEITDIDNLPATADDTNQYIINLFDAKKAPKLSPKTVEYYKSTLNEFMMLINKPLNKVGESDIEYYLLAKKTEQHKCITEQSPAQSFSIFQLDAQREDNQRKPM